MNKYTKADLMWEATRRNLDYLKDYAKHIEYKKADMRQVNDLKSFLDRLQPSKSWRIAIIKEESNDCHGFIYNRSILVQWLDPCIDIDEIKKEIDSGAKPLSVHPYAYDVALSEMSPFIYYHRSEHLDDLSEYIKAHDLYLDNIASAESAKNRGYICSLIPEDQDCKSQFNYDYKINELDKYYFFDHLPERTLFNKRPFYERLIDHEDDVFIVINKRYVRDNILFMFPPTATNESIINAVKEAKERVLTLIKKEEETIKHKGKRPFNLLKIDKYIEWLKKYDEVIDYSIKTLGVDKLTPENGALIVPDKFHFEEVRPVSGSSKDFYSNQKAYKDAYWGSVKLIQDTPDIVFSPSRT